MKRFGLALVVIGAVSLWIGLGIRSDYAWSTKVIAAKTGQGWSVASTTANVIDLTRPWTIIRPSITRIAFVRLDDVRWIETDQALYQVRWVDRDLGEDLFVNLASCTTGQSAFVPETALDEWSLESLEWRSAEAGTPGEAIVKFVCASR